MKNELKENYTNEKFEDIKHIDENGVEFWYARELMIVLEYKQWRRFESVIEKAKIACENSGISSFEHFANVGKTIKMPKGAEKTIKDYELTRYACYLIAQNGDSRKKVIALAQTYFAVQTRKQEILETKYDFLSEDQKRLYQRNLTRKGNYNLQKIASSIGVKNMAEFHNYGYKGLYNGETADDIFKRKGLRYREDILDNMIEDELIANLFRINQTKQKLIKDNIKGENNVKNTHYEVGRKVRKAIKDIGGTMPEDLPTPNKSIKQIEKDNKNNLIMKGMSNNE